MSIMQRLVKDEKIGFNYDYMGYAEYEFGANTIARAEVSREETVLIQSLMAPTGGGRQWKVNILLPKWLVDAHPERVHAMTEMLRTGKHLNKGPMESKYCLRAWLMSSPLPCLIYEPDLQERVDLFVADTRKQLTEAGYTAESYLKEHK